MDVVTSPAPPPATTDVIFSALDDDGVASLREALRALRHAGDLVERVAYPDGAARSPLPGPLAEALFAALSGVVDGERNLRRALQLAGENPSG